MRLTFLITALAGGLFAPPVLTRTSYDGMGVPTAPHPTLKLPVPVPTTPTGVRR